MRPINRPLRGFSIVELLVVLVVLILLMGSTLPLIEAVTCDAQKNVSIANLQALAEAHAMYAADWNDRQFTLVRDDLGAFGSCEDYNAGKNCHPPVILGEDCEGIERGFFFGCGGDRGSCDEFFVVPPINFYGTGVYLGSFRLPNVRGFHEYVNGRFFDPIFYAPKDAAVYEKVAPFFDVDCEYVNASMDSDLIFSASYVLSPAAMFHPDVMRSWSDGGWQNPWGLDHGFESPSVSQARYPAQKSRMIEHNWLQNPPAPCNPAFPPCEPYHFNHGLRSVPMTLFYDGHVNGLSTSEALRSNARIKAQTGIGLWSLDTSFGSDGYLGSVSYDFTDAHYHILTTDGILGRDTLE